MNECSSGEKAGGQSSWQSPKMNMCSKSSFRNGHVYSISFCALDSCKDAHGPTETECQAQSWFGVSQNPGFKEIISLGDDDQPFKHVQTEHICKLVALIFGCFFKWEIPKTMGFNNNSKVVQCWMTWSFPF